jgi:hypothetical protein
MLDDLRKKMLSIRQSYLDDLDRLINDVKDGRVSGDEYRVQASARRARFFEEDKAAHGEMSERLKSKPSEQLSQKPKAAAPE